MKEQIDYQNEIKLDHNQLEVECLLQPELMMKYGRNEATLERERDLAKEALDSIKADIDMAIRKNPGEYIDAEIKLTETVYSNTVKQQPEYIEAFEKYLNAQYEFKNAINAVKAFGQRKDMIEALIKLHGQNYFAGPNVPHDSTLINQMKQSRFAHKVGQRLNRK